MRCFIGSPDAGIELKIGRLLPNAKREGNRPNLRAAARLKCTRVCPATTCARCGWRYQQNGLGQVEHRQLQSGKVAGFLTRQTAMHFEEEGSALGIVRVHVLLLREGANSSLRFEPVQQRAGKLEQNAVRAFHEHDRRQCSEGRALPRCFARSRRLPRGRPVRCESRRSHRKRSRPRPCCPGSRKVARESLPSC